MKCNSDAPVSRVRVPVPFFVLPRHELTGNTMFGSESGSSFTTADPEHSSSHVCLNACTGLDQSQTSLQPYRCGREIRLYVLRPTGRADNRLSWILRREWSVHRPAAAAPIRVLHSQTPVWLFPICVSPGRIRPVNSECFGTSQTYIWSIAFKEKSRLYLHYLHNLRYSVYNSIHIKIPISYS